MLGDIGLSSGWQGDNAGATAPGPNNDYVVVPIARQANGSPITGLVMGRIVNATGPASQPIVLNSNPLPYKPATLDTTKATLTTHTSETIDGKVSGTRTVASSDWAWARCSADNPFPGTPDPTQICVKGGFDPIPAVPGCLHRAGSRTCSESGLRRFATSRPSSATRTKDSVGTANPVAKQVSWIISRGRSQSGRFLRAFLHLGFNQDEAGRQVHDGAWPIIAPGRLPLNVRFGTPDAATTLYDRGNEGPVWWTSWPDPVRGLPAAGILDRCSSTKTCPKIVETMGGTEAWALNLSANWVGTSADKDIPRAGQRSAVLHSKHSARRRRRRIQRDACRGTGVPRTELRPRHVRRQSDAVHRNVQRDPAPLQRLGDEGHAAAAEQVSDAGERLPRGSDEGGDRIPEHPGRAVDGADRFDQSGARLRLGRRLQLPRWIRRGDERAAARSSR